MESTAKRVRNDLPSSLSTADPKTTKEATHGELAGTENTTPKTDVVAIKGRSSSFELKRHLGMTS